MNPDPPVPRCILVGGFLGAGKTTAIQRLAAHLVSRGLRVGLITNDQAAHLVDTIFLRAHGFPTEEIHGGCFCCRFNSLMEAADRLADQTAPDVFIAEPVGSCTDLVATVIEPLRQMYGERFRLAPFSVLLDPLRAARILGLETDRKFSENVRYIYRKQLEESDLIVINKSDLLTPGQQARLSDALAVLYPGRRIFALSARTGAGLAEWFSAIETDGGPARALEIDYAVYADGEARLGWLNAQLSMTAAVPIDGNEFLRKFAIAIYVALEKQAIAIAHLKLTLATPDNLSGVAMVNCVRNDWVPELSATLDQRINAAQVTVNLRAEAAPERLAAAVDGARRQSSDLPHLTRFGLETQQTFRPGKPEPTYRYPLVTG